MYTKGVESFTDFLNRKLGPKWIVAERTKDIIARYGEDVVCISKKRFDALRREYEGERNDSP